MVLLLINLIQAQSAKASWLLWGAAGLFFLLGLALLVYLIMNSKKADQLDDPEEGGVGGGLLSKEKLLNEIEEKRVTAQHATVAPETGPILAEPEEAVDARQTISLASETDSGKNGRVVEPELPSTPLPPPEAEPQQVFDEPEEEPETDTTPAAAPPNPEPEIYQPPVTDTTSEDPYKQTQVLTSQAATPVIEPPAIAVAAPDEEIYSPQEEALFWQKESSFAEPTPAPAEPSTRALSSLPDESASARVAAPASPQRLEQSAKPRREPFEPPTIEPLTPRLSGSQELASQNAPGAVDEPRDKRTATMSSPAGRKTTIMASPAEGFPEPPTASPADPATLPLSSAQTSFKNLPQTKPQPAAQWQGAGTRAIERKPAGSVLGLPAEASDAPLIIGQPSHARDEEGVAALSNYGKDMDASETGRGGAITLLIAILLIAGAALLYFYVPAVRTRADALVARIRGQQNVPVAVEKAKAQIYPALNPEVVKNLVKARGAVTNISEETLEELSVEVSLDRGEGTTAEVRTIAVKPNVLAPRQQGLYEFEYEGGKTTGFSRYRVTKLLSKNGEVKFKTPNQ